MYRHTIKIRGASDDLVEVYGRFGDEFGNYGGKPLYLAFDTGIIVVVQYTDAGVWIVGFHDNAKGDTGDIEHTAAVGADDDNYSDVLCFSTAATRMFANEDIEVATRMAKGEKPPRRAFMEAIDVLEEATCVDDAAVEVTEWLRGQMGAAQ